MVGRRLGRRTIGAPDNGPRQWVWRLGGSVFGVAACVVGAFSLLGATGHMPELNQERAYGFGITAIAVGLVAIVGSLTTSDAYGLWHCSPRRWRLFRDGT